MRTPEVVIYHGNCQDGFTAAWVVHRALGDYPEYIAGTYGKFHELMLEKLVDKDVLLDDITYSADEMKKIASIAKTVVVLDHHKSAAEHLSEFHGFEASDEVSYRDAMNAPAATDHCPIIVCFDMARSGAQLAWDHFNPNDPAPYLVRVVQDRDLWRFQLTYTRPLTKYLFSMDYTFDNWDLAHFYFEASEMREDCINLGLILMQNQDKEIRQLVAANEGLAMIRGIRVPIANLPRTLGSEAAHYMLDQNPHYPFVAVYEIGKSGEVNVSLRSRKGGTDVSTIAYWFGGGGHASAAGFRTTIDVLQEMIE
jgi:oligoribonuclease NrnB/cAMP/cGMP phosphodiesterase (DHH superfamily)